MFESLTDPDAFAAIEAEWRELSAHAGTASPYLDFDWVMMCFRRLYGTGRRPLIAMVRENGRLVLALPLHSERRWLMFRRWRGMETLLPQNSDALVAPDADRDGWVGALLAGLGRDHMELALAIDRLPERSRLLGPAGSPISSQRLGAPSTGATFPDGYDAYFAAFGSASRSQARRMRRHMERRGELSFRFADPASFDADFDWFLERKRAWTPRNGKLREWVLSAESESDLRGLAQKWLADGRMWLGQIEVGGARAAAAFGFSAGAHAIVYASTYNPEFADTSPGRTLKLMLFEHLVAAGITSVDFMGGNVEWKRRLRTTTLQRHRVRIALR